MKLFVTDMMEILFGGAMVSLIADFGWKKYGAHRGYFVGSVSSVAIGLSLVELLRNWKMYGSMQTRLQPVSYPLASLYIANNYTIFVMFTVLTLSLLVSLYSTIWLKPGKNIGPFNSLLLLLVCSVVGVASAGDLLTLFIFWEAMSVSAYGLVSFDRSGLSLESSLKYFFLGGVGSLVALFGIATVYLVTGSIALDSLAATTGGSTIEGLGMIFILLGFGVEAGVVPLHTWLPDVYSAAPTPSAAIMSGIVTGIGMFALVKIAQPFTQLTSSQLDLSHIQLLLAGLGLVTMLVGNLGGLAQTNLRRILGYSSVAQTGYMLSALSTFTTFGLLAVVFTIWNHGVLKSGFFTLTGAVEEGYTGAEFESLRGVGRQNKPVGIIFALSTLAMVGSPPFGLFWSEILIVRALAGSGQYFLWLAVAVTLNIVLSIGYYYRVINVVVLSNSNVGGVKIRFGLLIFPIMLIGLSLLTGLFPSLFLNTIA